VLHAFGGRLLSCLASYPTAAAVARCAPRCWPGMTRTTACCPGAATRARGAARQRRASRSPRPQTCRPACLHTGSGSARRAPRCGCRSVCRRAEVLSLLNLPPCKRRSWARCTAGFYGLCMRCAVPCIHNANRGMSDLLQPAPLHRRPFSTRGLARQVMSQQTQVARVVEYHKRWVARWPTVQVGQQRCTACASLG